MISAQRFVENWRQNHITEPIDVESLAQMLVEYTEQFVAKVRADERERMAYLARMVPGGGIRDIRAEWVADLYAKVEALPDSIGRSGSAAGSLIWRGAVLALFKEVNDD